MEYIDNSRDKSQSLVWNVFVLQTLFSVKTNIIHPESIHESKYLVSKIINKYVKGYYSKIIWT